MSEEEEEVYDFQVGDCCTCTAYIAYGVDKDTIGRVDGYTQDGKCIVKFWKKKEKCEIEKDQLEFHEKVEFRCGNCTKSDKALKKTVEAHKEMEEKFQRGSGSDTCKKCIKFTGLIEEHRKILTFFTNVSEGKCVQCCAVVPIHRDLRTKAVLWAKQISEPDKVDWAAKLRSLAPLNEKLKIQWNDIAGAADPRTHEFLATVTYNKFQQNSETEKLQSDNEALQEWLESNSELKTSLLTEARQVDESLSDVKRMQSSLLQVIRMYEKKESAKNYSTWGTPFYEQKAGEKVEFLREEVEVEPTEKTEGSENAWMTAWNDVLNEYNLSDDNVHMEIANISTDLIQKLAAKNVDSKSPKFRPWNPCWDLDNDYFWEGPEAMEEEAPPEKLEVKEETPKSSRKNLAKKRQTPKMAASKAKAAELEPEKEKAKKESKKKKKKSKKKGRK